MTRFRKEVIGDATLILGDCRDLLEVVGPVEAVVTDPPYGLGDKMLGGTWGAKTEFAEMRTWDQAPPAEAFLRTLLSVGGEHVFWGGAYFALPPSRCWLLWDKTNAVPTMADFEMAWTDLDRPAKRFLAPVGRVLHGHPTEKPEPLMRWCVAMVRGQSILDPYMGSGTTGVACAGLGRRFVGVEIHEPYFDTACRRIEAAHNQPRLFEEPKPKVEQGALFSEAGE